MVGTTGRTGQNDPQHEHFLCGFCGSARGQGVLQRAETRSRRVFFGSISVEFRARERAVLLKGSTDILVSFNVIVPLKISSGHLGCMRLAVGGPFGKTP